MEQVTDLSPDLVIVLNDSELVQNLQNAGFKVYVKDPQSVAEIIETIREFGQMFNVEAAANPLADDIQADVDAVTSKVADIPGDRKVKVFHEVWGDPLMTAGPGSFISDIIRLAGGINIGDAGSEPWPQFSLESVVDEDPGVIITSFEDTYNALMNGEKENWQDIKAVKEQRILLIDQNLIARPSVRLVQALEQIASFLYPDRFE